MSTFIHLLRLKIIESDIQHNIYRVDLPSASKLIHQSTDTFLERLYAWRDAIPPQSKQWGPADRHKFRGDEYMSYDSFVSLQRHSISELGTNVADKVILHLQMASYHKSLRVLLQPRLYEQHIDQRYLDLCAEACRGVCQTYKRLHQRIPLAFTSVSLQSVFLAGLTLVYCMWHDHSHNGFKNFGALTDCSIILYVMAERWPAGRKYRDLFESVKKSVLEVISEEKHVPRMAVVNMKDEMQTSLHGLQANPATEMETIHDDLDQMISDMTGEQLFSWEDHEIDMIMGVDDGNGLDFSEPVDMFDDMLGNVETGWENSI